MFGILTKGEILKGQVSAVRSGTKVSGELFRGAITGEGVTLARVNDLAEIVEGECLLIGDLKTSPIDQIVDRLENKIVIKTRTSIYTFDLMEVVEEGE